MNSTDWDVDAMTRVHAVVFLPFSVSAVHRNELSSVASDAGQDIARSYKRRGKRPDYQSPATMKNKKIRQS